MSDSNNTLQRPDLINEISNLRNRVLQLERLLQGQPVGNARIDDLSWSKGKGGTLQLGGAANGNGVLSLLDYQNIVKILMDNTGILINDGAITLKDENNITKIDSKGLVSSANFGSGIVSLGSDFHTSSTSFVDITGMSLTFDTPRNNTKVLIGTNASGVNSKFGTNGSDGQIALDLIGIDQNYIFLSGLYNPHTTNSIDNQSVSYTDIVNIPTAGTYTLRIQLVTGDATSVETVYTGSDLFYVILGA